MLKARDVLSTNFFVQTLFCLKALPVMNTQFLNTIAEKSKEGLKGLCVSLGRHNDALYAVLAIAVFKGIFRPAFTMMDKNEKPEVKRYAAFREGLTEGIAFISYFVTSKLLKKVAKPICEIVKRPEALGQVEHSMSFLAVCLSAGIVIPAVCNLTLKPLMDLYNDFRKKRTCGMEKNTEEDESPEPQKLDIKENIASSTQITVSPVSIASNFTPVSGNLITLMQNNITARNAGMKVGG